MNKPTIIGIAVFAVLALAGAGYYAYLANNGPEEAAQVTESESRSEQPTPATDKMDPDRSVPAGTYTEYSDAKVANAEGTKILFFHAPWCPQCRALDSELNSASLPDNTTIFKTDYDSNQALRSKYGVTLQTTFVAVDDNGDLVEKYVAYDEPTYDALNREFISKL